jgi:hypothetical protein
MLKQLSVFGGHRRQSIRSTSASTYRMERVERITLRPRPPFLTWKNKL